MVVQPNSRAHCKYEVFLNQNKELDLNNYLQHNEYNNVFALGPMLYNNIYSFKGTITQSVILASNIDD